jgi:hypothetical protein
VTRHAPVHVALVLPCLLATAACRTLPGAPCPSGQQAAVQELVYFGADKPGGQVTAADWAGFLATEVTPRFPAGLTSWQASGQWRSASGALVQEPSYVLSLVHPPQATSDAAVAALVAAYKRRFSQEAVLRVRSTACMAL